MQQYGFNTSCAGSPMSGYGDGYEAGLFGLAAVTPAQRQAAAAARKTANQQKVAARKAAAAQRKAVRVAGKTVNTSRPQAATAIAQQLNTMKSKFSQITAGANNARKSIAALNSAKQAAAAEARTARTAAQRAQVQAKHQAVIARAQARAKADVTAVANAAKPLATQIAQSHSGVTGTTTIGAKPLTPAQQRVAARQAAAAAKRGVRGLFGLGVCDPTTFTDEYGNSCDPSMDAGMYPPADIGNPYGTAPYQQSAYPTAIPAALDITGLTSGFGIGMPMMQQMPTPRGCNTGSNLPRCLIYQMAQDEQQQFQFVFTILQQMYAQLLQIVQQLMTQLQSASQQPYPYGASPYGDPYANPYAASPYGSPYAQSPYGDPYGMQYGAPGAYPGPMGYPGIPYSPGYGGDSSMIPEGYGDGSDMFGASGGIAVPGDISQVFPGPGPINAAPGGAGPAQPNIISSDSLPVGSEPNSDGYGGDDAAGLISTAGPSIPLQSPNSAVPSAQPVSAGPTSPTVIVLQQQPGQAPYPDASLPLGPIQNDPDAHPSAEIQPASEVESWAQDEI